MGAHHPVTLRFAPAVVIGCVGVLVSVVTWPVRSLDPGQVTEYWPIGLHVAAMDGLRYGHDVVFTYGPLAFLAFPLLVDGPTGVASFVYAFVAHTALAILVLAATRRSLHAVSALVAAIAACTLPLPLADVPVLIVFGCAAWLVLRPTAGSYLAYAGLGTLAGAELLLKFNDGAVGAVIALLACIRVERGIWARTLTILASAVVAAFVGWVSIGMRIGDVAEWLRLSVHLASSYTQGMERTETPAAAFALALCLSVALVGLAVGQALALGKRRGAAIVAMTILFAYGFLKEGFVRADDTHNNVYFAAIGVGALCVAWSTRTLGVCAIALAAIAVAHLEGDGSGLFGALLVVAAAEAGRLLGRVERYIALTVTGAAFIDFYLHQSIDRVSDTRTIWLAGALLALAWTDRRARIVAACVVAASLIVFARAPEEVRTEALPVHLTTARVAMRQAEMLVSGARRTSHLEAYRTAMARAFNVPPEALHALAGKSVDFEPGGAAYAWAYGLKWLPQPLIENYSAYDTTLDQFAADAVARRGPARIVQGWASIDGQYPLWQAPALIVGELCNYRQPREPAPDQPSLLYRSRDRCKQARLISTLTVPRGRWVSFPRVGNSSIVYATFGLDSSIGERVRSILTKPPQQFVETNPGRQRYKFIPGTASEPHVLHVPPVRGIPAPAWMTQLTRLRVLGRGEPVRIAFYAVPVTAG